MLILKDLTNCFVVFVISSCYAGKPMEFHVSQERAATLLARMEKLGINEAELTETFIRGSGSGGQKINKTSSCVRLVHEPTGVEIRCQQQRSQAYNRYIARTMMCDRVEALRIEKARKRRQASELERRRKRGRPAGVKRRMIKSRAHRSKVKQMRRKPSRDD